MIRTLQILLFTAVAGATSSAFAFDDPAWPTYQGSATHSGFIDRDVDPASARPAWTVTPQAYAVDGIAVGAGVVYVTPWSYFNADPALVALDLTDGVELWRKTFPSIFSINPPAYDASSSTVFVQTGNHGNDTYLRAYDAVTGAFRWRSNFSAQWERYLAPTVLDGVAYIQGGYYGGAYAFGVSGGTQSWFTGLPQYDGWTPTPYGADRLLAYTNVMSVLDRATGTVLYSITDPDYSWSGYDVGQTPLVIGDHAFVTNGGFLIAYDVQARSVLWKQFVNASGQVSSDGRDLFVISAGAFTARSPADGSLRWGFEAPANVVGPILVFRKHVIASTASATYLINRETHVAEQTWPIGGVLAYADDRLLIGQSSGQLTAIELISTPFLRDGFE